MSVTDGFLCEFCNDLTLAHCDAAGSRPPQQEWVETGHTADERISYTDKNNRLDDTNLC